MRLLKLRERPGWRRDAAAWFHSKWGVPEEAYLNSMADCIAGEGPVPQWYLSVEGERILGGAGVIENDFHFRKDLRPNLCALCVEEPFRGRGIAKELLRLACGDMRGLGVDTLYLITDHTAFYERCGWRFLCMVQEEAGGEARMYIHGPENGK